MERLYWFLYETGKRWVIIRIEMKMANRTIYRLVLEQIPRVSSTDQVYSDQL